MTDITNILAGYINTHDPFLLFFGSFYFVLGVSCFFARNAWKEFAALFVDNDALSLIMGVLILPISLSIIAFYWNWETLGSTILMVTGILALIKALTLLMRPSIFQNFVRKEFVRKWLWLDGVSGITLGLAMLLL
ncbi:MAG: hypothetical protein GW778_03045 [Alphaproteobacteria bacterium]|nr:hypothetical protein [Alphaproteobacteria bacterium]